MSKFPPIILETPKLVLRTVIESDCDKIQAFEERNKHHLSPWMTPKTNLESIIINWKKEFEENRSIRFLSFLKEQPEGEIIGFCNFTQILRGPFQACYLGYQIDSNHEGKGLMHEGVNAAIQYMFTHQNIHRIMANYMPSNHRSAKLLEKLGFVIEGEAKKYLFINGKWEDHILTSLTNHRMNHP